MEPLEQRAYFAAVAFAPVDLLPAGQYPTGLAVADLNADGNTDIIETNYGNGTVGVLRGHGNGSFSPMVTYPVGNGPESVAVGDVNGDGIPDIVVANSGLNTLDPSNTNANSVSVLLGNGDGTFAPATTVATGIGPDAVALADFNGDGHLDIATANLLDNTIAILPGNGDGTFGPAATYATGYRPQGLAVADFNRDGHPDLVTGDSGSTTLSVFINRGDGTFKGRVSYNVGQSPHGIIAQDLGKAGRDSIVVTNLDDRTFSILHGIGNGTFDVQNVIATGVNPFGVAAADLNGNNRTDIVSANGNGTISVRQRTGTGYTLDRNIFTTGKGPQNVAIADFNNDGKPDLVTTDFADGTVGILLNITPTYGEKKTNTHITSSANPALLNQPVTLTAAVGSDAGKPAGNVVFYDDGSAIGTVAVAANRTAMLTTATLPSGINTLTAQYQGAGGFAESSSKPISQVVTTSTTSGRDLVGTFDASGSPSQFVPGETVSATFTITNQGDQRAKGTVASSLFLTTNGTLTNAIPVSIVGNLASSKIKLKPGQSTSLSGSFVVPPSVTPGTYGILADINSGALLAETDTANNVAVSPLTYQAVYQFGTVGGITNVTLALADGAGIPLTFNLTGPGNAVVQANGDGLDISVTGTTANSAISIATPTGSRAAVVNSLTVTGGLSSLAAGNINFSGPINLDGSVNTVAIENLSGLPGATAGLNIGGSSVGSITMNAVAHASLSTPGNIGSLSVTSWQNTPDDRITAGSIGTLSSTGVFGPVVQLTGTSHRHQPSLKVAKIGTFLGSVSVAGKVNRFVDQGPFDGVLAATRFGSIAIQGSFTGDILAGANLGDDAMLGGGDDTFGVGIIQSLRVVGDTTNAIVAAGLDPVDEILLNGNDTLLPGGRINSITLGPTDSLSRFVADHLPSTASIQGNAVGTKQDPRFGQPSR